MTDQTNIQLSQGLIVLPPKSDQAYPIPCEEWVLLKSKMSRHTSEPWFFHTIGSILLGAALSTLIAILTGTFHLPDQQRALDIAWSVLATTVLSGLMCLLFAHKERGVHREQAREVVALMDLIEKRYERPSP
jgi:RNAse (barnase) inhibitor barstar